jgi:hypothetical protein
MTGYDGLSIRLGWRKKSMPTNCLWENTNVNVHLESRGRGKLTLRRILKKILIVGGEVQLGPFGTAGTNRPMMSTPGDYDNGKIGGMMIDRGNRSTRRKPAPVPLCPLQIPHAVPGQELGPQRWEARDYPPELWHGLKCV